MRRTHFVVTMEHLFRKLEENPSRHVGIVTIINVDNDNGHVGTAIVTNRLQRCVQHVHLYEDSWLHSERWFNN